MSKPCEKCRHCCKPSNEIVRLTPRDVWTLAYCEQADISEIIDKYCDVNLEGTFPEVYLLTEDCPFLQKNRCGLPKKFDVCESFPQGYALWFGETPVVLKIDCKTADELSFENISKACEDDAFYKKWTIAYSVASLYIQNKEKQSERQLAIEYAFEYLYLKYNANKPFLKQFSKNILEFIEKVSQ